MGIWGQLEDGAAIARTRASTAGGTVQAAGGVKDQSTAGEEAVAAVELVKYDFLPSGRRVF